MKNLFKTQVQYPGLQLFAVKEHEVDFPGNKSFDGQLRKICKNNEKPNRYWHIDEYTTNVLNSRKISDTKLTAFNDSSPTLVGGNTFDDVPEENNLIPHFWFNIINKVFEELPYGINDQFDEEFQYNIITSIFLHDLHGYGTLLKPKVSILDFLKNNSHQLNRQIRSTTPTKYGHIRRIQNSNFEIIETLDYSSVVLSCLKVLYRLKKLKRELRYQSKRIVIALLIIMYLVFQQKYFRIQYTKYKTIKVLKTALKSLEVLDKLFNQYHLRYKELNVNQKIDIPKQREFNMIHNNSHENLRTDVLIIEDLLSSTMDHLYFKLVSVLKNCLPFCQFATLNKYCDMFDITILDLHISIFQQRNFLAEKSENINTLIRFMLCCLLSMNRNAKQDNIPLVDVENTFRLNLTNIFGCNLDVGKCETPNEGEILNMINENIENLCSATTTLISLLTDNRDILNKTINNYELIKVRVKFDESSIIKQMTTIENTLCKFEDQIKFLKNNNNYVETDELNDKKDRIMKRLHSCVENLSNRHNMENHVMDSNNQRNISGRNTSENRSSIYNRGFSLDVLKTLSSTSNDTSVNLNRKVDFISVESEDDMSSLEENIGEDVTNIDNNNLITTMQTTRHSSTHYQSMRQLSDEQLQRQLNNEIQKFSAENKKSKENLRTEKSFELLKRQRKQPTEFHSSRQADYDFTWKDDGANTSRNIQRDERQIASEETIPLLYKIEEFMKEEPSK